MPMDEHVYDAKRGNQPNVCWQACPRTLPQRPVRYRQGRYRRRLPTANTTAVVTAASASADQATFRCTGGT